MGAFKVPTSSKALANAAVLSTVNKSRKVGAYQTPDTSMVHLLRQMNDTVAQV